MEPATALPTPVYARYRDNLPRHLLGLSTYLQTRMMHLLQQDYGHTDLRLSFAPYITLAGEKDLRVSQVAELLGISRQACNQAAQLVERAGYLERLDDPDDGRAKILRLTSAGQSLRRDGVTAVRKLDTEFATVAGAAEAAAASRALGQIYSALRLSDLPEQGAQDYDAMGGLLPRLADYILLRLMELTRAKGHDGLKISFGQVLPFIGANGGSIQQIANLHQVSKQAISAIANELEELGYLCREPHPTDARQLLLQFTPRGRQLIADSVRSTEELEAEFQAIVGKRAMRTVGRVLRHLYLTLQPEHGAMLETAETQMPPRTSEVTDLRLLAGQLRQQLGEQRCLELAALLNDSFSSHKTSTRRPGGNSA